MKNASDAQGKVGGSMKQYGIRHTDWPTGPGVFRLTAFLAALSALVVTLTFCPSGLAQSAGPAELTALQRTFAFDDQLKKVKEQQQAATDALQLPYTKALDALQAKLQKAGDLNGLEVVAKEAARFQADGKLSTPQVSEVQPDLRAVQEKYLADTARVDLDTHLRIFALRAQYAARVAELQKRLTMAGRIQDAKAVRAEFVRVATVPDVAAAEAVAKGEFEKEYAKYQELVVRNAKPTLAGKTEMDKAWQALCQRWYVADAGRTPGKLTWNDGDGTVQTTAASSTPILPQERLAVGQAWTNSLGMEFVPVPGTDVLFCKWETRVQDYTVYARDVGSAWQPPPTSNPSNPAVGMNWSDAQAFCKWLTEREHAAGVLSPGRVYRLPKDWEWSVAVGLKEGRKGTPAEKNGRIVDVYPWGNRWPPPTGAGNYGPDLKIDSFPRESPVGSFPADKYGLFDMGGNVREWCEDDAEGNTGNRPNKVALRGGSWNCSDSKSLLSSSRYLMGPDKPSAETGIRCVLTKPFR